MNASLYKQHLNMRIDPLDKSSFEEVLSDMKILCDVFHMRQPIQHWTRLHLNHVLCEQKLLPFTMSCTYGSGQESTQKLPTMVKGQTCTGKPIPSIRCIFPHISMNLSEELYLKARNMEWVSMVYYYWNILLQYVFQNATTLSSYRKIAQGDLCKGHLV